MGNQQGHGPPGSSGFPFLDPDSEGEEKENSSGARVYRQHQLRNEGKREETNPTKVSEISEAALKNSTEESEKMKTTGSSEKGANELLPPAISSSNGQKDCPTPHTEDLTIMGPSILEETNAPEQHITSQEHITSAEEKPHNSEDNSPATSPSDEIEEKNEANTKDGVEEEGEESEESSEDEEGETEAARPVSAKKDETKAMNKEQIRLILSHFIMKRPSKEEVSRMVGPQESDDSSDSEDSEDSSEEDSNLPLEEQLQIQKSKTKTANETIRSLLIQVNQYKMVLEDEKQLLQKQLKESREERAKQEKKVETLKEALHATTNSYEQQLKLLEEEKMRKGKENISNLQTLLKELSLIEEANTALSQQLEEEKERNKSLKEEIVTSKQLLEAQAAKIKKLEEKPLPRRSASVRTLNLVSPRFSQSMAEIARTSSEGSLSDKEDSTATLPEVVKQRDLVTLELDQVKQELAHVLIELEAERQRVQTIDSLASQIKALTGTEEEEDGGEEKKISQQEQDKINSLTQRVKDLKQLHANTLRELNEEREVIREGKELIQNLEKQIRELKTQQKTVVVVTDTADSDSMKVTESSPDEVQLRKKRVHNNSSGPFKDPALEESFRRFSGQFSGLNSPSPEPKSARRSHKRTKSSDMETFASLERRQTMVADEDDWSDVFEELAQSFSGRKIRQNLRNLISKDGQPLLPADWDHMVDGEGNVSYVNKKTMETSAVHPLLIKTESEKKDKKQKKEKKGKKLKKEKKKSSESEKKPSDSEKKPSEKKSPSGNSDSYSSIPVIPKLHFQTEEPEEARKRSSSLTTSPLTPHSEKHSSKRRSFLHDSVKGRGSHKHAHDASTENSSPRLGSDSDDSGGSGRFSVSSSPSHSRNDEDKKEKKEKRKSTRFFRNK